MQALLLDKIGAKQAETKTFSETNIINNRQKCDLCHKMWLKIKTGTITESGSYLILSI